MSNILPNSIYTGRALEISNDHFGVIVRNDLTDANNDDFAFGDGHLLNSAIASISAKSIRFPGGNEPWRGMFDFRNPEDVEALHKVIDYCFENDLKLNFTISARDYVEYNEIESKDDDVVNITRQDIDELQKFLKEGLLGYAADRGVLVSSIKIGNEFLAGDADSPGYSAQTYGDVASQLTKIVGEAVEDFSASDYYPPPAIIINGAEKASGISRILEQFDNLEAKYLNGVDLHSSTYTLKMDYPDYAGGLNSPAYSELAFRIDQWENISSDIGGFSELSYTVDAWSVPKYIGSGASLEYAGVSIHQLHNFSSLGVSSASAWVGFGWDANALVNPNSGITAAGSIFEMMSESLPGLTAQNFDTQGLELERRPIDFLGFGSEQKHVFYIINRSESDLEIAIPTHSLEILMSGISTSDLQVEGKILGVVEGSSPSNLKSQTEIEYLAGKEILDGNENLSIHLDPFEIAEISVSILGEIGAEGNDKLTGSGTRDVIFGLDGNDRLFGWNGDDFLNGGKGDDVIYGNKGNDVLYGGGGADQYYGGSGYDQVSYWGANSGVVVDMRNPLRNSGDAENDTYKSIESVVGTQHDDIIRGDLRDNSLFGGAANDVLIGRKGSDYFDGGDGNDIIYGGRGADTIVGGDGSDTLFGGRGHDVFSFSLGGSGDEAGPSSDTIGDFMFGQDIVFFERDLNNGQTSDPSNYLNIRFDSESSVLSIHNLLNQNSIMIDGMSPDDFATFEDNPDALIHFA